MNIICLYWEGDFRGRDFTPKDVENLYHEVAAHIDREFTFYCLTNVKDLEFELPIQCIQLKHDWPGWWAKMELHREDLPAGKTLYLDLDTKIVNSLQPILDFEIPQGLTMFSSPYLIRKDKTIFSKYQAGVMLFEPGVNNDLYYQFLNQPGFYMEVFRSDQDFLGKYFATEQTFPKEWLLKMASLEKLKEIPEDVIIITGQPKKFSFRDKICIPNARDKKGVTTM